MLKIEFYLKGDLYDLLYGLRSHILWSFFKLFSIWRIHFQDPISGVGKTVSTQHRPKGGIVN